jgi:hypothetical protein
MRSARSSALAKQPQIYRTTLSPPPLFLGDFKAALTEEEKRHCQRSLFLSFPFNALEQRPAPYKKVVCLFQSFSFVSFRFVRCSTLSLSPTRSLHKAVTHFPVGARWE